MEKMNQVSVTEFMSKSKEEMYDMAVEMVEKYNRLVDICNDSAERIADLIVRHKVYTDALKNDIASKDAKIEKLEKEIEGRKECYTALKELVDTKYISIEEHNNIVDPLNKEIERINRYTANVDKVNHDLVTKVTLLESELADCKVKIRHQKENLDGINKTLEIRTKEKENLISVRNSQEKEIEAHEEENKRLSEKIMELKKERDKHMARVNDLRMELDCVKASKEKHEEAAHDKVVEDLRENIKYWRTKYLAAQEERDALQKELENEYAHISGYNKLVHSVDLRVEENKKLRNEINGLREDVRYWKEAFETQSVELADKVKENTYLEKELEETCKTKELDLKNHNKRDMALVDELAGKNDEIKKLKEENSYLKSEIKQKQNIIKKAYERYSDEVIKTRKDLMEVAYRDIEKDNGYVGFKLYVKSTLIEAKGDKNEANEIITEAVRSAYTEWDKTQKENEKTIKKAIKEVKSKRGTPDIPCGEDAIE